MGSSIHRGHMIFRILSVLLFVSMGSIAIVSATWITPVDLGTAGNFTVLAGASIANTGPTVIKGDLGLSPGTSVTGDPTVTGTKHVTDSTAAQAQTDLTTAYINARDRPDAITVDLDISGQTIYPGIYKSGSTLAISSDNLTLDALGNSSAVWIFQIGSTLDVGTSRQVILINGARPENIFWQVGSAATLGTDSVFKGNILAQTSITLVTGATLDGRALARTGAPVILDTNTITKPATISITVTGDISDWTFIPQSENSNTTAIKLSGSCDGGSCTISVYDNLDGSKPFGTAGHMAEYNTTRSEYISNGKFFTTNMSITGNTSAPSVSGFNVALGSLPQTIETITGSVSFGPVPIWVNQSVWYTDPPLKNGNVYQIVITFVGGASA